MILHYDRGFALDSQILAINFDLCTYFPSKQKFEKNGEKLYLAVTDCFLYFLLTLNNKKNITYSLSCLLLFPSKVLFLFGNHIPLTLFGSKAQLACKAHSL